MTQSKKRFFMAVWMILILSASTFSQMASSKAAAMKKIPLEAPLSEFKKKQASGKLTADETKTFNLLKLCQQLGISSFTVYSNESTVSLRSISNGLLSRIKGYPAWDNTLSSEVIASISSQREVLLKVVGDKTYPWAWVLYRLGEKAEAKKILRELYEAEFQRVMQLKVATYGLGNTPFGESEFILQALEPMSTPEEKEKIQGQMKKMKIHISNLPQSHVVT